MTFLYFDQTYTAFVSMRRLSKHHTFK